MMDLRQLSRDILSHRMIKNDLEKEGFLNCMKASLWKEVTRSDHVTTKEEMEDSVKKALTKSELHIKLKNEVFKQLLNVSINGLSKPFPENQLYLSSDQRKDYLTTARLEWTDKLMKSLIALTSSVKMPLIQMRPQSEIDKLEKKWHSLSTVLNSQNQLHPIYSAKDLFNTLQSIRSPNISLTENEHIDSGRIIHSRLSSKSLTILRKQYSTLHPTKMGSDLTRNCGQEAVKSCLCVEARQACRFGCPVGLRYKLWSMALGMDTNLSAAWELDKGFSVCFQRLKSAVLQSHFLIDDVVAKDVNRTAANDVEYFIFEDTMHQILLAFFRDKEILKKESDDPGVYPANGVIPFHGFSMYVAPLCYLHQRPEVVYTLFKRLYIRYFSHLTTISYDEQGIVALCELFETLMMSRLPELFQYLIKIKCHPLSLVLPWMMSAFSGILSAEQVLLLWDLIIGYDSLEILPVLAVSFLEFRAKSLFQVSSVTQAEAVLSSFNTVTIMPLLQQTLFL